MTFPDKGTADSEQASLDAEADIEAQQDDSDAKLTAHALLERAVASSPPTRPDPVLGLVRGTGWLVALGVTSGVSALVWHASGDALAGPYLQ